MLILNGNKFARSEKEFTNSLFETGSTCVGFYKPLKSQIKLFDHNHNLVGVITKHKVLAKATQQACGKYWYSYGDIGLIGRYDSIIDQYNEVQQALYDNNIL